jgi:Tol biopolymer transport system component
LDKTARLDGNWAAFVIGPDSGLYICDLRADASTLSGLVSTNARAPSLSADGHFVAYELHDPAVNNTQIMVADLKASSNVLASVNGTGTGGGNGNSATPVISGDGRFVVFRSRADDLVGNDTNTWSDIFVRDLRIGTTYLLSTIPPGQSGDELSANPQMGPDGRTVVFQSFASNLGTGDRNNRRDVFLIRLGAGDSDGDGLPDDWEVTYLNNLDRDGTGDFDNDGQSDRAEYLAGTNPTDNVSILQVLSITVLSTGERTILWSAVPGRSYRLQYKDDLSNGWNDFPIATVANNSQCSAMDTSGGAGPNRFYRVVALP